jgi:hypothetical protein
MNDSTLIIHNLFDKLESATSVQKNEYLEKLLFAFTITGRAIWSDEKTSDRDKIEGFKYLNELTHRIWNTRYVLIHETEKECVTSLKENLTYYGQLSKVLGSHLRHAIISASNGLLDLKGDE